MSYKKRKSIIVTCNTCNLEFQKENREIKRGGLNYCSRKCAGIAKSKTINPYNYYTTTTRSNAKAKNLEHNLTPEFLEYLFKKQHCKCSVSNIDIHIRTSRTIRDKSLFQASIDRIDNSKGYIVENVHFVALGINYMRNTVDLNEVNNFIYSIKNSEPLDAF